MRKGYRTFITIDFAFVASLVASFAALGITALVFGFQIRNWTEWEGTIAGMIVTVAGVFGAILGLCVALRRNE